jgi:hypothetical protein
MGRARYLVVTAAAVGLIGCGDDANPDSAEITKELERDVQEQTGTRDVRVICGEDVGEGDLCDVTAAGGLKAQVKITRLEDGDVQGEVVQP